MSAPVERETNDLALALRRLNSTLAASNRAMAAHLGINDSDLAVLDLLSQSGPLSPTMLADRTCMSPTTMASALKRLERDGWILRRRSESDGRVSFIELGDPSRLAALTAPVVARLAELGSTPSGGGAQRLVVTLDAVTAIVREETERLTKGADSAPRVDERSSERLSAASR